MALEFPKSFPSWVFGPEGAQRLITSPAEFAGLNPLHWADSPADWLAPGNVCLPPPSAPEATISSEEIADILDGEVNVGESANVPFEAPAPEPVPAPVKRGPGRPRKVQA